MRRIAWLSCLLVVVGCSEAPGCVGFRDLTHPLPTTAYVDNAAVVHVTPQGVDFLESKAGEMIGAFSASSCNEVPCPSHLGYCDVDNLCQSPSKSRPLIAARIPATSVPDPAYCYGELAVCPPGVAGFNDCAFHARLDALSLTPESSTGMVGIDGTLAVSSTRIPIQLRSNCWLVPNLSCDIYVNPVTKSIAADLSFHNGNPLRRLAVNVGDVDIALAPDDFYLCNGILNFDWIKSFIFGMVEDQLHDQLQDVTRSTVDGLLLESCTTTSDCSRPDASSCDGSWCRFPSGAPVLALLGLEATVDLEPLLGAFAGRAESIDFSVAAQHATPTGGGLRLGLRGGADAPSHPCTPDEVVVPLNAPPLDVSGITDHVAVGLSDGLMAKLLSTAFSAGAFCQRLDGIRMPALTVGALTLLLPSLAGLAPGRAPLVLDVRPRRAPRVEIGRNIVGPDPTLSGAFILQEPLVDLIIPDLDIDISAETANGSLVRALTLRISQRVDLSVVPAGTSLRIVAGDASRWIHHVEVLNSSILAEDPAHIAAAVPPLLAVLMPTILGILEREIPLPEAAGFRFALHKAEGQAIVGTTERGHPRAAWATLQGNLDFVAPSAQASATRANLVSHVVPSAAMMRTGAPVVITIDADAEGRSPNAPLPVLWHRVDNGAWRPLVQGTQLVIRDPALHLEGHHRIDIASAPALGEAPGPTTTIAVTVDRTPPLIEADVAGRVLALRVTDGISPPVALEVTLELDGDSIALELDSEGRAAHSLAEPGQRVVITARDEADNTAVLTLQNGIVVPAPPPGTDENTPGDVEGLANNRDRRAADDVPQSCQQTGNGREAALFALLGMLVWRVRSRRRS